jgi:tetratricopeptide (TPR) repeat protein
MPYQDNANPARHEVERQLERILADDVIASHPQPSKLLDFIVRRTLNHEEITEKLIREFVFPNPPYKEDSNIARITMSKVKSLLLDYYRDEGEDDPVVIALPESPEGKRIKFQAGQAYTPEFRYNPRAPIAKTFAIANHLLRGGPAQIEQGLWELDKIFKADSNHPEMVLGTVEAVGSQLLLGVFGEDVRKTLIDSGFAWIDGIAAQVPDYWRVPMVRGLLHYCDGNLEKAGKEFEIALSLDRRSTISRGWYTQYLFAIGRQEEAVKLMALNADERVDNAQAHALHGIYLSQAQKYPEAEKAFAQALALDRNCWPAHFGMTRLCIATGREHQAKEHAKRLESLVEPAEYEDMKLRFDTNRDR